MRRRPHRAFLSARLLLFGIVVVLAILGVTTAIASNRGGSPLPAAKQAYLDKDAQRREQAAASNAAQGITKSNAPSPSAAPAGSQMPLDPQEPAGDGVLIQSTIAPAGVTDTLVKNRWYLSLGGAGFLVVFAGCDFKNTSDGVVLVSRGPGALVARFVAPGAHGCLSITAATGRVLQLVAADGFKIQFDSTTLQFQ